MPALHRPSLVVRQTVHVRHGHPNYMKLRDTTVPANHEGTACKNIVGLNNGWKSGVNLYREKR